MIENVKAVEALTAADLAANPIWQYTGHDVSGEMLVRAVKRVPVRNLTGKLVGTQVHFANGKQAWAMLGNVDNDNARLNEHFITLSVEHEGKWFHLARYHDHDFADRGPEALCRFIGMQAEDVFPITYDLRQLVLGNSAALAGAIQRVPRERLSRAEVIALAVP